MPVLIFHSYSVFLLLLSYLFASLDEAAFLYIPSPLFTVQL